MGAFGRTVVRRYVNFGRFWGYCRKRVNLDKRSQSVLTHYHGTKVSAKNALSCMDKPL